MLTINYLIVFMFLADNAQVYDVLPPEEICVTRIPGVHFNWTEARICRTSSNSQILQYRIRYESVNTEMSVVQVPLTNQLNSTIMRVSNKFEYYFEFTTVITSTDKSSTETRLSSFSHCFNVTSTVLNNNRPMCKVAMFECASLSPSTTTVTATTPSHLSTFEPNTATSSYLTDTQPTPIQDSPTEPSNINSDDMSTAQNAENFTTDITRPIQQGKIDLCMHECQLIMIMLNAYTSLN